MNTFLIQYALTLLAIVLIPLMLWYGKRRNISRATYIVFALLVVADIAAYLLLSPSPSYIYLAVITLLAMFLVKH